MNACVQVPRVGEDFQGCNCQVRMQHLCSSFQKGLGLLLPSSMQDLSAVLLVSASAQDMPSIVDTVHLKVNVSCGLLVLLASEAAIQ